MLLGLTSPDCVKVSQWAPVPVASMTTLVLDGPRQICRIWSGPLTWPWLMPILSVNTSQPLPQPVVAHFWYRSLAAAEDAQTVTGLLRRIASLRA